MIYAPKQLKPIFALINQLKWPLFLLYGLTNVTTRKQNNCHRVLQRKATKGSANELSPSPLLVRLHNKVCEHNSKSLYLPN